jgi:FtsH-binding integral membrane protein
MSIIGATIVFIVIVALIFLMMWYAIRSEKKMKSREGQENPTPSHATSNTGYIENNHGNQVATLLMIVGIVTMIVGIIIGFITATPDPYLDEFQIAPLLIWSFAGISSGAIFIGISEIVKLLEKINHRLRDTNQDTFKIG